MVEQSTHQVWIFTSSSHCTNDQCRYHPNDIKSEEFSDKMKGVQKTQQHEKQRETFLKLRKSFHPVLRHYFTEQHKAPIPWFTTRLAYTRSVATTSIVGHVLGLGDRHSSNILMDHITGEVVHIDLGIAFDQVSISSRFIGVDGPTEYRFRENSLVSQRLFPSA
jgi:phosphatidylinositol kinase/protein kinase (PI-3  family)